MWLTTLRTIELPILLKPMIFSVNSGDSFRFMAAVLSGGDQIRQLIPAFSALDFDQTCFKFVYAVSMGEITSPAGRTELSIDGVLDTFDGFTQFGTVDAGILKREHAVILTEKGATDCADLIGKNSKGCTAGQKKRTKKTG